MEGGGKEGEEGKRKREISLLVEWKMTYLSAKLNRKRLRAWVRRGGLEGALCAGVIETRFALAPHESR